MDGVKKDEYFSTAQVQQALELARGNVSAAARALNTTRSTLYNYLTRYPLLKTVLADARETMLDTAETALHVAAAKGEGWAVCFMLKTIGRTRGYIEKHEVVITDEREVAEAMVTRTLELFPAFTRAEAVEYARKLAPEVDRLASELVQ